MSFSPIKCELMDNWISDSEIHPETSDYGICIADSGKLPFGLQIVVVINDGDFSSGRKRLTSIKEIQEETSATYSIVAKNQSLSPWKAGFWGKSMTEQISFEIRSVVKPYFSIANEIHYEPSFQDEPICQEITVKISPDVSNKKTDESIAGAIEIRNDLYPLRRWDYLMSVASG